MSAPMISSLAAPRPINVNDLTISSMEKKNRNRIPEKMMSFRNKPLYIVLTNDFTRFTLISIKKVASRQPLALSPQIYC